MYPALFVYLQPLSLTFVQNLSFVIKAWDFDEECIIKDIIENISQTINIQGNCQQTINKRGMNGIGYFKFTYNVTTVDGICVTETSMDSHTDQQVTLSPADNTSFRPADNTTTHAEVQESCSSIWAWIAVAILFILLTLLLCIVSIVQIGIIWNKTLEMKKIHNRTTCEVNGKNMFSMYIYIQITGANYMVICAKLLNVY